MVWLTLRLGHLNYGVTITDNTCVHGNHSYAFTPSTIDVSSEESADFQRAREIMRRTLNRQSDYIKLFQWDKSEEHTSELQSQR